LAVAVSHRSHSLSAALFTWRRFSYSRCNHFKRALAVFLRQPFFYHSHFCSHLLLAGFSIRYFLAAVFLYIVYAYTHYIQPCEIIIISCAQESCSPSPAASPRSDAPSVGPLSNGPADEEPSHKMPAASAAAKDDKIVYAPDSNPEGRVGATETEGDLAKMAPASSLVALALRRRHLMKMLRGLLEPF
jgi:hypothetical protein